MPQLYGDVGTMHDDGVSARITKRTSNIGVVQFSFQLFRTYQTSGEERATTWMNPQHFPAMQRLLVAVAERIALEKSQ